MIEMTANDRAAMFTVSCFLMYYCFKVVRTVIKARNAFMEKANIEHDEYMRKFEEECEARKKSQP